MSVDRHSEENTRLPGEASVPLLAPLLTPEQEAVKRERIEDRRYKSRQLKLTNASVDIARSNRNLTFVLAIFTLFGVIAAFVQGYYASKGVREARAAAFAARLSAYEACRASQISRAALIEARRGQLDTHESTTAAVYQALASTEASIASISETNFAYQLELGRPIGVALNFQNTGSTAAKNVVIEMRAVFIPRDADPDFAYPRKRSGRMRSSLLQSKELFINDPGAEHSLKYIVVDESGEPRYYGKQEQDAFQAGKMDLISYARVTYADQFGTNHWYQYCSITSKLSGHIVNTGHPGCVQYNKSDSNSPVHLPRPLQTPSDIQTIICTEPSET